MYRPISPHIIIYKPQFSSLFSVFHRTTGVVLALGVFFLIFVLLDLINSMYFYSIYLFFCTINTYLSWLLVGALLILIFSFSYHISNGIRHFIWDFSTYGESILNKDKVPFTAYIVALVTLIITLSIIALFSF